MSEGENNYESIVKNCAQKAFEQEAQIKQIQDGMKASGVEQRQTIHYLGDGSQFSLKLDLQKKQVGQSLIHRTIKYNNPTTKERYLDVSVSKFQHQPERIENSPKPNLFQKMYLGVKKFFWRQ